MTAVASALLEFWNAPSNVEWCEARTHSYQHSSHVAEFWNTISNIIFVIAGAVGLRRVLKLRLPWTYIYTEAMLIVVGLGSMLFHARRNYVGEMLDELPMSAMAVGYFLCINDLHWLTSSPTRITTHGIVFGITAIGWICYVVFHIYEMFTLTFTLQILAVALISLRADPELGGAFCSQRWLWWAFLVAILTGKALWELERWLHRQGACPPSPSDPRFFLHPAWHVLAATAHTFWVRYASLLALRRRDGGNSEKKAS